MVESVPPELLLKIFGYCIPHRGQYTYHPGRGLFPFLLVSKLWKAAAEELLYRSISIGYTDDVDCTNQAKALAGTLKRNTNMSSLVRTLSLSTFYDSTFDETAAYGEILTACKLVENVEIDGYDYDAVVCLSSALKDLEMLKHLSVSQYSQSDKACGSFCTIDQLFELILGWSRIETILVGSGTTSENAILRFPKYKRLSPDAYSAELARQSGLVREKIFNPPGGCCIYLRSLEFREECMPMDALHTHVLPIIAPSLERLSVTVYLQSQEQWSAMRAAILTWSSTLKELSVNFDTFDWRRNGVPLNLPVIMDEELCGRLTQLRTLTWSTHLAKVQSLQRLGPLETLTFMVSQISDIQELSDIVHKLTMLKNITLTEKNYRRLAIPKDMIERLNEHAAALRLDHAEDAVRWISKLDGMVQVSDWPHLDVFEDFHLCFEKYYRCGQTLPHLKLVRKPDNYNVANDLRL
ncbi:hypothetical protein BT96DRAFT_937210 [Gymnopus androsaceus JB14]|uniref:Uncharacterized protein n=1 Tax=Gymnopus androsaceus JB14 TaxID=1447944 RepID=A0A6A4HYY0_9AGAR|nr:hypothetical protein BT96DRAFT_937210 [Gymnopus androsaceus JB14]